MIIPFIVINKKHRGGEKLQLKLKFFLFLLFSSRRNKRIILLIIRGVLNLILYFFLFSSQLKVFRMKNNLSLNSFDFLLDKKIL